MPHALAARLWAEPARPGAAPGALRAERPDLLTVVLPQSLSRQPPESQELLLKVMHVVEAPQNDDLPLLEASRLCNEDILGRVQQVICFAFHDSRVLLARRRHNARRSGCTATDCPLAR